MTRRRAARTAAVMNGTALPTLPPLLKRIPRALPREDDTSSSSNSPDSLYSGDSPTLPDPAFEYDGEEEVEQHDEAEYESLMAESEGWQTPAWGAWPEMGGAANYTPSPTDLSPSRGTIISISPAGSMNSRRGRRGSFFRNVSGGKTPTEDSRRGSDPSLLGFDLASPDRRRFTRRRSSVMSNGSVIDPAEDMRLRNIASMDLLRRRFSEVVEISGEEDGRADTAIARRIISQWSPYSDNDDDDDASEIHTAPYLPTPPIRAPVPTVLSNYPLTSIATEPEYADTSSEMLISRTSSPASPLYTARSLPRIPRPPPRQFATPPPPVQPATILRERTRPGMQRAITDYQFPPKGDVIPTGATVPRPTLHRSTSTPFFSASAKGRDEAMILSARVSGAFPLQRPAPLGVSPLREGIRRQSIVSDSSRRGSVIDSRRPSIQDRRVSLARETDLRRVSMDRRMSIELRRMSLEGRKLSLDGRKMSVEGRKMSIDGRKMSIISTDGQGRRSSTESRTLSSPVKDVRRPSSASIGMSHTLDSRRTSEASRKSSIVSISEYGYLAPQIVIDAPPSLSPTLPELTGFRRNAPPSIVLPEFTFPSSPNTTPGPTSPDIATPRYHPMDSFLGRASPSPHIPATPSTVCPLSPPSTDQATEIAPDAPVISPRLSIMDRPRPLSPPEFRDSFLPRFKGPSLSPMNTTRESMASPTPPVEVSRSTTPETRQVSRKAVPRISAEELKKEERVDQSLRRRRGAVGNLQIQSTGNRIQSTRPRLPSPPVSAPIQPREFERYTLEVAPPASPQPSLGIQPERNESSHRRITSSGQPSASTGIGMGRPPNRRQVTLPNRLELVDEVKREKRKSHIVFEESTWRTPAHLRPSGSVSPDATPVARASSRMSYSPNHPPSTRQSSPVNRTTPRIGTSSGSVQAEKSILKRASVTFSEETQSIPPSRPSVSRASSFTRFFKSRPQSISGPPPSAHSGKPVRPSIRPVSTDGSGLGSWMR